GVAVPRRPDADDLDRGAAAQVAGLVVGQPGRRRAEPVRLGRRPDLPGPLGDARRVLHGRPPRCGCFKTPPPGPLPEAERGRRRLSFLPLSAAGWSPAFRRGWPPPA